MRYRKGIPPLSALTAFESAARLSSFTRAAREQHTSQPAISRQIDNLETRLNCALFERSNNRIQLTSAGRRLQHSVTKGLDEILLAVDEISKVDKPQVFRLTCTYDIAHCWLLPRYQNLLANLSNVDLQIIVSESPPDFNSFTTDMAIGGKYYCRDDIERRTLLKETVFPVCTPKFAARHADTLASDDLSALGELPLMQLTKDNMGWASWETWFRGLGVKPPLFHRSPRYYNYTFMLEAAIAGEGLALGWEGFLDAPLLSGQLVVARPERVDTQYTFQAMWRPGYADQGVVDEIIRYLKHPSSN